MSIEEKNIRSLLQQWNDPGTRDHQNEMKRRFLRGLRRPERRSPRFTLAASLLIFGGVYLSLFLGTLDRWDTTPGSQDVQEWIDRLGAEELDARDEAAEKLLALGEKVRSDLEKALKNANPEIRSRAGDLLKELDRRRLRKKLGDNLVRIGDAGLFLARNPAFEILGNEESIPDWLEPALRESDMLWMVLAEFRDGRVVRSEMATVSTLMIDIGGARSTSCNISHFRTGLGGTVHSGHAWKGSKKLKKYRAFEIFRHWSRLRKTTMVLSSGKTTKDGFRAMLDEALKDGRADVRAMAVLGLQNFVTEESVTIALNHLDDKDERIRAAAKDTRRVLLGKVTPKEWAGMNAKDRQSHLPPRYWANYPTRGACCDEIHDD